MTSWDSYRPPQALSDVGVPAAAAAVPQLPDAAAVEAEVLALFAEYRRPLLRYVRSMGLGAHDAEDVVQDTFVALHQHLWRGRDRRNLAAWLFRVAANLGRRHRGRWRRWWSHEPDETWLTDVPDPSADPERSLLDRQQQARWQRVLQALPLRDRRCVVLRAEGHTYRHIAGVLGVSVGTVAQVMARAIARFERAGAR